MKSQNSITGRNRLMLTANGRRLLAGGCWLPLIGFLIFIYVAAVSAQQRIAIILPAENPQSLAVKNHFEKSFSKTYRIIDSDLAKSVFQAGGFENPYNLSTEESKNFAAAVGCDYFLLLKADNQRRTSFAKPEYYESYAAAYVVSSRTGRLVFWVLKNAEAEKADEADEKLSSSFKELSNEISDKIARFYKDERNEILPDLAEIPDENSAEARTFRAPLPYRRLRPAYTTLANLYNVTATVDALLDLDENGKVTRVEIVRWAGYGLDESVIKTINEMQWRAASRDGKTLPIRVLLRYNFKKIEKEE